jgi:hypothetical protein
MSLELFNGPLRGRNRRSGVREVGYEANLAPQPFGCEGKYPNDCLRFPNPIASLAPSQQMLVFSALSRIAMPWPGRIRTGRFAAGRVDWVRKERRTVQYGLGSVM